MQDTVFQIPVRSSERLEGIKRMLHKCANDACTSIFRYLRQGKLFYVETEVYSNEGRAASEGNRKRGPRRVEHFWLCDECCRYITLTFDQNKGVLTVPLPNGKKTVRMLNSEEAVRARVGI